MAKHKVSELSGALLDAAVAKAEGVTPHIVEDPPGSGRLACSAAGGYFRPSTSWGDAGPIIERDGIGIAQTEPNEWCAACRGGDGCESYWLFRDSIDTGTGPTPLIAAMRAYVASKFGEEVELP